jgi:hypothetical protein
MRGQGTIEYLLITAVVIVIALVLVSLLTGMMSSSGTSQSISNVKAKITGQFSLLDLAVTPDGNYITTIQYNDTNPITITNIYVNDTNKSYDYSLVGGNKANFKVVTSDACTIGTTVSKTVTIYYTTSHGILKKQFVENVLFTCNNVSATTVDDTTTGDTPSETTTEYVASWLFNDEDTNYIFSNTTLNGGTLLLSSTTSSAYFGKSTTNADLNANYNNSSYANLSLNGYQATGELDWNNEAVNTTTSGGWGELINDYNVQVGNLQGVWHLNNDALDSSGNSNDGVWGGTEGYTNGLWGTNAGDLDGSSYVNLGSALVPLTGDFTINNWVKIENHADTHTMFSQYNGGDGRFNFEVHNALDIPRVFVGGTGGGTINATSVIEIGKWYNTTLTRNGSTFSIYVNGNLENSGTITRAIENTNSFIGAANAGVGNVTGNIEEVGIWNTALTEQEVKELYEAQKGQWLDTNLVAYYKFNGNANDSARGHNGTLEGNANTTAQGLWDSNALDLDGTGDYVSIAENDDLKFDNNLTISAWVNSNTFNMSQNGHGIFSYGSGSNGYALEVIESDHGTYPSMLRFMGMGLTDNSVFGTFSLELNTWYHIVAGYDGSELFIYVNGELDDSDPSTGTITTPTTYGPRVGYAHFTGGSDNYWSGLIDEVKIYNRRLSDAELLADYNAFLEAKFVNSTITDATTSSDWNTIKINSDLNYSFNKEICGVTDTGCEPDKWNDNLVGLWHLNETSGDAIDSSGQGNDGTWVGTQDSSNGLWGTNAGYFNELSYINTGTTDYCFDGGENFTINFWGNFETFNDNPIFFYTGEWHVNGYYIRAANTSGNLQFYISTAGSGNYLQTNETASTGVWQMYTFQKDGSSGHIYLNGNELTYSINQSLTTPVSCTNNATIGANIIGAREIDGTFEELAIWNKSLTQTEIQDLYRKGISRLDLNVYECTDATCTTKGDNNYITDANSNTWMLISGLSSRYLGYDAYFKTNETDFGDYNAGFFHVGSFIADVNVEAAGSTYSSTGYTDMNFTVTTNSIFTNITDTNSLTGGTIDHNIMFDGNGQWFTNPDTNIPFDTNILLRTILESTTSTPILYDLNINYTQTS